MVSVRPSGTVAFLLTDIEESSALWEADPAVMREVRAGHDELLADDIDAHGGVVFASIGDGISAAFGRAGDAVAAANDVQRLRAQETSPGGGARRQLFRPDRTPGGSDYGGRSMAVRSWRRR